MVETDVHKNCILLSSPFKLMILRNFQKVSKQQVLNALISEF
jgi:hypothetical protein